MIPRIINITKLDQFNVYCLTNLREIIRIDFHSYFEAKAKKGNAFEYLLDINNFQKIKCNGRSLYWEGLVKEIDENGTESVGTFELDPVVLFEKGIKVEMEMASV